jgi:hypothetical protein
MEINRTETTGSDCERKDIGARGPRGLSQLLHHQAILGKGGADAGGPGAAGVGPGLATGSQRRAMRPRWRRRPRGRSRRRGDHPGDRDVLLASGRPWGAEALLEALRVVDLDNTEPVHEVRSRFDRWVKEAGGGWVRAVIHPPGETGCYFPAAVAAPAWAERSAERGDGPRARRLFFWHQAPAKELPRSR